MRLLKIKNQVDRLIGLHQDEMEKMKLVFAAGIELL